MLTDQNSHENEQIIKINLNSQLHIESSCFEVVV